MKMKATPEMMLLIPDNEIEEIYLATTLGFSQQGVWTAIQRINNSIVIGNPGYQPSFSLVVKRIQPSGEEMKTDLRLVSDSPDPETTQ